MTDGSGSSWRTSSPDPGWHKRPRYLVLFWSRTCLTNLMFGDTGSRVASPQLFVRDPVPAGPESVKEVGEFQWTVAIHIEQPQPEIFADEFIDRP